MIAQEKRKKTLIIKPSFVLLFALITVIFSAAGCQSSLKADLNSFPTGHDMHPETDKVQKNEPHPLQAYS